MERIENDRLGLAEEVLVIWEQMLLAGSLTVENLALATNEVKILEAHRLQDPQRVDDLIRRFQAIASSLSSKLN